MNGTLISLLLARTDVTVLRMKHDNMKSNAFNHILFQKHYAYKCEMQSHYILKEKNYISDMALNAFLC